MDAENEQGETKEAQEAHLLDLYNSALQVFPNCGIPSILSPQSRFVNRLQFQLGSGFPVDSYPSFIFDISGSCEGEH